MTPNCTQYSAFFSSPCQRTHPSTHPLTIQRHPFDRLSIARRSSVEVAATETSLEAPNGRGLSGVASARFCGPFGGARDPPIRGAQSGVALHQTAAVQAASLPTVVAVCPALHCAAITWAAPPPPHRQSRGAPVARLRRPCELLGRLGAAWRRREIPHVGGASIRRDSGKRLPPIQSRRYSARFLSYEAELLSSDL